VEGNVRAAEAGVKYVLDTEFIDTPTCSALISLAIVREDGAHRYFEFDFPESELTPWLRENVVPHMEDNGYVTESMAALEIERFIGTDKPEFWAYYGAYDWYWFCRLWGGFMSMPDKGWPIRYREFADVQDGVPDVAGAGHNALNDCRSILHAMKLRAMV
jgi:hypothetical protein